MPADSKELEAEAVVTEEGGHFFRRTDWSAFWTACAVSFVVYFYTLAPTVTLEDSGELAVAGDYLGVPHPPGYPIWSMLAWVFTKIFAFVPFRGQPNPAWSIGLMSAVFGALASGVTAMLISRSGWDILQQSREMSSHVDRSTDNMICWVGGVVCSLVFAFSPVMWSQSVIVEVYSLNAFFLMLIFLLVYMWNAKPSDRLLYVTAFIFGLGLTNYQVLLLAGFALVVTVLLKDPKLFLNFLIVGIPYVLVIGLMATKTIPLISHPLSPSFFVYLFLNLMVLTLAYFLLPRGKTVAITLLLIELGVAFYAYMPIVSDLRNPPMNWGYPRTWQGFKHAISRGQYEKIAPTDIFTMKFVHQVGFYLTDIRRQFYLPIALLGFLPFCTWQFAYKNRRYKAMYAAVALSLLASLFAVAEKVVFPEGEGWVFAIDKGLVGIILVMMLIGATIVLVTQGRALLLKLLGKAPSSLWERTSVAMVIMGAIPVAYLYYVVQLAKRIGEITAPLRSSGSIAAGEVGPIFLQVAGVLFLIIAPVVLIAVVHWLMQSRLKLETTIDFVSQKWIISTLFGFMMLSIGLMALANFTLEIQDTFIQRVKLISSHALFALWMGYGLIFGLAFVDTIFRGNRTVKWLSLSVALLLPIAPIGKNAFDAQLIKEYGGPEQHGHDFGWQFGNYELRGAEAITEELGPDEEPLPNPSYPPEMGQDAVFFGGTDPGRFVPTYMIYSARVREDVYLITQNALADNTYMSVMRDLYGDQIWIPAQTDSGRAFQIFVKDIQSGDSPYASSVKIENGRVQVSGALQVMEINGILAKMIFDHNKYRHPFYVEESYVIRWMYPYLTPHGLIMKINAQKTPLTTATIHDDQDFWDWYTRRLFSDSRFLRDIVARKSFSKLRSAIGGLYANRNELRDAETAFQQARILYPLSPEANFRLVQEVLMRQGRFGTSREIMADFSDEDPYNIKARKFLDQITQYEKIAEKTSDIEKTLSKGQLDVNKAIELARLYVQGGQIPKLLALANSIIANKNLPPVVHFQIAQALMQAKQTKQAVRAMDVCLDRLPENTKPEIFLDVARAYAQMRRPAKMRVPLERYLKQRPGDWKAWLDLASLQMSLSETNEASRSLEQALRSGGNEALQLIQHNPQFEALRKRTISRTRNLIGIP